MLRRGLEVVGLIIIIIIIINLHIHLLQKENQLRGKTRGKYGRKNVLRKWLTGYNMLATRLKTNRRKHTQKHKIDKLALGK